MSKGKFTVINKFRTEQKSVLSTWAKAAYYLHRGVESRKPVLTKYSVHYRGMRQPIILEA